MSKQAPRQQRHRPAASKPKSRPSAVKKRSGFSGGSFLIGLLLGGGGVLIAFEAPGLFTDQLAQLPEIPPLEEPEIVFEFPEILRNSEVPADPDAYRSPEARGGAETAAQGQPDGDGRSEADAQPDSEAGQSPPASQDAEAVRETIRFHIQAASFRDQGEAERLRARLLLEDLPAYMARVELRSGAWYRVTLGPIESRSEANRIMSRLRNLNLSAIELKSG